MPESFAAYQVWIGFAFDLLIVGGIMVLWVMWRRSAARQQMVEAMLQDAARQLDEAGRTLSEALAQIERLQDAAPQAAEQPAAAAAKPEAQEPLSEPVARMLAMHGQGASDESIARELEMPLAQVRLMIRLHSSGMTGR